MKTLLTFVLAAIIPLTVSLFLAPAELIAQSGSPCGCKDVSYLINLLNEANAALDRIQRYEKTLNPNDMFNEIAPDPNPTRATKGSILGDAIREAMSLAQNKQAQPASGECSRSIREVQDKLRQGHPDTDFMPLGKYIAITREILVSEIAGILRRLSSMPKSCRPDDWFGTITVVEKRRIFTDDSVPGTDKFNKGTQSISNDTMTRTGTIRFDGNSSPFSSWQLESTYTKTKVHNGLVDCDSTPLKEDLVQVKSGLHIESKKNGSRSLEMEIVPGLSEDGRKFNIAFQVPAVEASGNVEETNTVEGGCPGMAHNKRESHNEAFTESEVDVQFEGSFFPGDPEKISGSEPKDLIPAGFSIPRMTVTHTVLVTYKLYRFHR